MTDQTPYQVAPTLYPFHECTQIYVRAKNKHGEWVNADIAELTPDSLENWAKTVSPEQLARILVQMCREWQYEAINLAADMLEKTRPQFYPYSAKEAEELPIGTLIHDTQGDYWEKDQHGEWKLYQFETAQPTLPTDGEPYTLVDE